MHIRLLSRLFEMAYGKAKMIEWVQAQVDNIVENYILIHIAKHNPVYSTMPGNLPHWERELRAAMGVIVGKESTCSRAAVKKGIRHLFIDLEELDRNSDVIRRKTCYKMEDEKVEQSSDAYKAAVSDFMKAVPTISELVSGIEPDDISRFVKGI